MHTITDGSFSPDIDKTVSTTRKYTLDILDAARQSPKVVSVVLTSSCHAGTTKPYPDGGPISVSNDSFAEYAWPQGKAITDDNPMMKGLLGCKSLAASHHDIMFVHSTSAIQTLPAKENPRELLGNGTRRISRVSRSTLYFR